MAKAEDREDGEDASRGQGAIRDRTVKRLTNAPKGATYAAQSVTDLTKDQADEILRGWWASNGTLIAAIEIEGQQDAVYERPGVEADRIPDGWTHRLARSPLLPGGVATPAKVEAKPARTGAIPLFATPEDPTPTRAAGCRACLQVPDARAQRHASPSTCIANGLCPLCWMPLPSGMTTMQAEIAYLHAVSKG